MTSGPELGYQHELEVLTIYSRMQQLRKYIQSVLQEATELLGRRIEDDDMEDFRRLKSSTVPGWIADIVLPGPHEIHHSNAVYIYDENGDYVGYITHTGGYRMIGSYYEYDRGKFNPKDDNSIQQAIRYLFLQTQKKQALSESSIQNIRPVIIETKHQTVEEGFGFGHEIIPKDIEVGEEINFPEIDNWSIKRIGQGRININDDRGVPKGMFVYEGDGEYNLYYEWADIAESWVKNKKVSSKDFTRAGVEKIVRWLYLKSQAQS